MRRYYYLPPGWTTDDTGEDGRWVVLCVDNPSDVISHRVALAPNEYTANRITNALNASLEVEGRKP